MNIKITKDELFHFFIEELIFYLENDKVSEIKLFINCIEFEKIIKYFQRSKNLKKK